MGKTVDQRVVEMRFDNKQFEQGASTTMSTLDKLKKSLNFGNIENNFDAISKAAGKVDMKGLGGAVQEVHNKFSALEVMAITALSNITNSIVNSAKHWAAEFTINPIKDGFKEYETQINAVQTILANTQKEGTNIKDVNKALDELNLYADKTIYNFTEMTKNIGTFTAAGVDLKTSVSAIQGIANLAAVSGSTSQQASTAMYQLSQAMASGTVKLQDWNSVVNAGMGGQIFQDALKETSRLLKTGADDAIKAEGSFRESLKAGWLTTEVLTETLKKFTTSGAAEYVSKYTGLTKEAIEAEVELAKSTYGEADAMDKAAESIAKKSGKSKDEILQTLKFAQTAEDAATKVKTFTQLIDTLKEALQSGWSQSFRIIIGDFEDAKMLFTEISDAFGAVIGASADARNKLLDEVFTKKDSSEYVASLIDAPKDAIDQLKIVAKEAGIQSDLFKKTVHDLKNTGLEEWEKTVYADIEEQLKKFPGLFDPLELADDKIQDFKLTLAEFGGIDADLIPDAELARMKERYIAHFSQMSDTVIGHMIEMQNSGKTTAKYLSEITGMKEESVVELQTIGKELGYTSKEFNDLADVLAEGDPVMKDTIVNLVKMGEVLEKPSGRELLIDTLRNALKGLVSVVKPVQEAFREVFPPKTADQVYGMLEAIHKFSEGMILSEKNSKNLKDTFKGVFDVVKLLGDGFVFLVKLIIPVNKPIGSLAEGILTVTGAIGRLLSMFASFVRSSSKLQAGLNIIQKGASAAWGALALLISKGFEFGEKLSKSEGAVKLIGAIGVAFEKLGKFAAPYIDDFISSAEDLFASLIDFDNIDVDKAVEVVSQALSDLAYEINNFSFDTVKEAIDTLKQKVKDLEDLLMSNEGFATFVKNAKEYGAELKDAFTWDNLMDRLEKIMDVFGKFFKWIKETLAPAFEDFNVGSAAAMAGGGGIIYAMVKMSNAFEGVSNVLKGIPDVLDAVTDTLGAYQKNLNASALIKIAGAIAILAAALVLLSFADSDRLLASAIALSLISAVLLIGVNGLLNAFNKGRELANAGRIFAKGVSSTIKKIGRAIEIRAIGKAIKDFAVSVAIIAGSFIALGIMYRTDATAFMAAFEMIKMIGFGLAAIGAVMVIASKVMSKKDATKVKSIGTSVLMISLSLSLVVFAISKLMKMELPDDYQRKLGILGLIFVGLAALMLVMAVAARIAGQNQIPKIASTFKALAIFLVATVLSLKMLFDMDLPVDYETKLGILKGIFVAFGLLMIVMAASARLSGGNSFKAAGTIMAMALFLVVVVGALFVLTLIPAAKMLKGAIGLTLVMAALAGGLYAASKIGDAETFKTVLAMAVMVGVIVAALAVLSMIPITKLAKATASLGIMLYVLAKDFEGIGKIKSKKAFPAVLAMIAATIVIAYSLYTLAEQPWQGMLAAAAAMSATLLAFGKAFEMVTGKRWSENNVKKIGTFLLMTVAVIPIGIALGLLAQQPWSGLLAAAAAMSSTLLAFALAFEMVLSKNWSKNNVAKIGTFLLMTMSVIPIGLAIGLLAFQPWANLLAAAVALSGTLLALTACFVIISKTAVNPAAAAMLLVGTLSLILIAAAIAILAQFDSQTLLNCCLALGGMLLALSATMLILSVVGAAAPAALVGMGLLALFIAGFAALLVALGAIFSSDAAKQLLNGGAQILVQIGQAIGDFVGAIINGVLTGISSALPQIGSDLSAFMVNLTPFIVGSKMIDAKALASVGFLALIILALTAAEIINGIASLFGLSLVDMAVELSAFMVALTPFIINSKQLTQESMNACMTLAKMILVLTAADLIAGIGRMFGLTGNLADFGKQLAEFGPHIKKFAEDVKDVKPEAVKGAAAAAEIMADLAKKLPGTGGLVQKIFGEKSLAEFGRELVSFGPHIKKFAEDVKNVKPEAVQGAAAAAEIMANLANKLPAQGGLLQKLMGEKSISEFGTELVKFGPKIVEFAKQVAEVNPAAVTGAAAATSIMSTVANNLPSSDTLWDKIFGGGQVSLSEFGDELVKFGGSMTTFSTNLSGFNATLVNGAIGSFKDLVDLANYIQSASATNIVNFANTLATIGTNAVDNFVATFTNAGSKVSGGINTMFSAVITAMSTNGTTIRSTALEIGGAICTGIITGITSKQPSVLSIEKNLATSMISTLRTALPMTTFNTIGQNVVQGLINGMNAKKPLALSTVGLICTAVINKYKTSLPMTTFNTIGQNVVQGLINGMNAKKPAALTTIAEICQAMINKFKSEIAKEKFVSIGENIVSWIIEGMGNKKKSATDKAEEIAKAIKKAFEDNLTKAAFVDIGENAAQGLADGIKNKIDAIKDAAVEAAKKAVEAAKKELKEKSPSKVMKEVGQFFSDGMAIGIVDHLKFIAQAGKKAASTAVDTVTDAVYSIGTIMEEGDFDTTPVIRPVVDLSGVSDGAKEIASMMNKTYDLSAIYDKAMDASASFNKRKNSKSEDDSINPSKGSSGTKYEFIQNNYSPKALTRSELYRQTNNQFSAFRRAVNPT